jgi:hypothetical protein
MTARDKEILDRCYNKCGKHSKAKKENAKISKVIKEKKEIASGTSAPEAPSSTTAKPGNIVDQAPKAESRAQLMAIAKEKGIKYFRILSKEELKQVLDPGVPIEAMKAIIDAAKERWQAGWGKEKTK